ncbi:sigma factor [Xylanimonas protaetiae]|uniref:sigma factor n=1 Tax=Xylanimonas protaetiae TaxID=2509457 RepID=UPI001A91C4A4
MLGAELLRVLAPQVLGVLVRRGADFAAAEDAVQDALLDAVRRWPGGAPDDPRAWLVTVAWRRFLDARRAAVAAFLQERAGNHAEAARLYVAAGDAVSSAERTHLLRQAARLAER